MSTLAEMLYESVDGSFAIDDRQRIIYWDRGCEELLGYSEHWALGRPCCSVMKGCHPVSGRLWCKENCPIADLPNANEGTPKSFLMKVNDNSGNPISLSVNIVLVPSVCKKSWHIMHLLHRSNHCDVLGMMDQHSQSGVSAKNGSQKKLVPQKQSQSRLTPRETEILSLMAEGISSRIISQRLHISHTTVRNHIQHIQKKLNVHSKTEAVAYAYRHHFL